MKNRRIIGRIIVFILNLSLVAGHITFDADYDLCIYNERTIRI